MTDIPSPRRGWKFQLRNRITSPGQIGKYLRLLPEEKKYFEAGTKGGLPPAITPYYFSLINKDNPEDPIRKQCVPRAEEFRILPQERKDPLGEAGHTRKAGLIHRYRDRVLVILRNECAVYCRHCFRRNLLQKYRVNTEELLQEVRSYLARHGEVKEIILSGGDPLVMETEELRAVLKAIRAASEKITIRIGTRTPVVLPRRFDGPLVRLLKKYRPLWLSTQFNHPAEITSLSRKALGRCVNAGIPVVNQTVLLKGINDNPRILSELFRVLVHCGAKPLYLFQGDLAEGTGHFRLPLQKSVGIYRELCFNLSGLARPVLALDIPGGGGKVHISPFQKLETRNNMYWFETPEGGKAGYPAE